MKKFIYLIITMFSVLTLSFFVLYFLPGSPFNDPQIPIEQQEYLLKAYGLTGNGFERYFSYISGVLRGELGYSFVYKNQSVTKLLIQNAGITASIGVMGFLIGIITGVILGVIAAINQNKFWDYLVNAITIIGISLPSFVIAALLQFYFGFKWDIFPIIYMYDVDKMTSIKSMILPSVSLSVFISAMTMKMIRNELIEIMNKDYFLFSKAKGLTTIQAIFKHGIKNALISVVTITGPMILILITGSTIIERFFGVPGLSGMMVKAIQSRDYFLIIGITLFYSFLFSLVLFFVDVLYVLIDPRIKLGGDDIE
jgi:oligopeptide transport system permease protein